MLISALFTIAMNENSPDVHQTMDNKNVLYFPKWNAVIQVLKKNKIIKFSDKRMKLESIIRSEVTKPQEKKCCVCSHLNLQIDMFHLEYTPEVTELVKSYGVEWRQNARACRVKWK